MSHVSIRIPTPLRSLTGGAADVAVEADTVGAALQAVEAQYEGLEGRLLTADGELRGFVNVFLGDDDIRTLDGLATAVDDGASISVLPAVAGGR
ncbi:MAG: ubiquitin-like small modifier protein 1 [Acidobacteriota bacterium]